MSRIRVLYLTFFEPVVHNGIYESQVRQLLMRLAALYHGDISLSHTAILPAVVVGRREVVVPFMEQRRQLAILRQDYKSHGIETSVFFAPVIVLKRWMGYQSPLRLLPLMAICLPMLLYAVCRKKFDIIHCRSYVATLLALAVRAVFRRVRVVFDMRGFYPEEGVIHHAWTNRSWSFCVWKRLEKHLIRSADVVIALSEPFRDRVLSLVSDARCHLIYASSDFSTFQQSRCLRNENRRKLCVDNKLTFIYSGGLGSWHDPEALARLCRAISVGFEDAAFVILTPYSHEKLRCAFERAGIKNDCITLLSAEPQDVPGYLAAAHFGLVPLRKVANSEAVRVVADTMIGLKVAEYLAAGLPVIANIHVGGLRVLMGRYKIGVCFDENQIGDVISGIRSIRENYQEYEANCKLVAKDFLSRDKAAQAYAKVYARLAGTSSI